ncbi:MAG: monovalent cation/H(+) antiporter subunit G [Acidobacteriota bacterium]
MGVTTLVLDVVGGLLLAAGSFVLLAAAVAIWRLPTFYTRIHAISVNDTLGPGLILLGLACRATHSWEILVKLGLILAFLLITGPVSSHALAKAAYRSGLEPRSYRRAKGGPPSTP